MKLIKSRVDLLLIVIILINYKNIYPNKKSLVYLIIVLNIKMNISKKSPELFLNSIIFYLALLNSKFPAC